MNEEEIEYEFEEVTLLDMLEEMVNNLRAKQAYGTSLNVDFGDYQVYVNVSTRVKDSDK